MTSDSKEKRQNVCIRAPQYIRETAPYITSSWISPALPNQLQIQQKSKEEIKKKRELLMFRPAITHCIYICPNLKV